MADYPQMIVPVNHVEPVPRRIRATLGGVTVLDTTRALYVWEWPNYPQYYVPIADVRSRISRRRAASRTPHAAAPSPSTDCKREGSPARAPASCTPARSSPNSRARSASIGTRSTRGIEEDEEVFVHPRNPYARVDALRSTRRVRVELDGVVLAESSLAGDGLRDRPADPLLPQPHRGQLRRSGADRHGHRLPVQGHDDRLLVGAHAGDASSRTSRGPTTSRPASCCRSPGSSPSTTRRSTSSSTARRLERPKTHFFR